MSLPRFASIRVDSRFNIFLKESALRGRIALPLGIEEVGKMPTLLEVASSISSTSMFDVRCSMFDVRCSVFDVHPLRPNNL
jgi:hypothetical protein